MVEKDWEKTCNVVLNHVTNKLVPSALVADTDPTHGIGKTSNTNFFAIFVNFTLEKS